MEETEQTRKEPEPRYMPGVRLLGSYDIEEEKTTCRLDILLLRVLEEGPNQVSAYPERQYHFDFEQGTLTVNELIQTLRNLATLLEKNIDGTAIVV